MDFERIDRAEREVLGAVLYNDAVFDEVATILSLDDFRSDAHRLIWREMAELFKTGRTIQATTIADALHKRGRIDDVGGIKYIAEILDAVESGLYAVQHARIVRHDALLRRLADAGRRIAYDAENPHDDADRVLESAEQQILALGELGSEGQTCTISEIVTEVSKRIDDRAKAPERLPGLASGLQSLDAMTAGFQNSELVVLAARPGVGKTALAVRIAAHAAMVECVPVFFASLEMSRLELGERLLTSEALVDARRLRHGSLSDEEIQRIAAAAQVVGLAPMTIDESPRQSMLRIAANARRLKRKHGIGLVIVDYLQLVEPENRREPRHEQVGAISRRLKILAREIAVPVVALAQLNRETENRAGQRPRLSDLRESGSIEADADTVILMHRPADQSGRHEQVIDLLVEKQRNGPTGTVSVRFHPDQLRFDDMTANPF